MLLTRPQNTRTYSFYLIEYNTSYLTSYKHLQAGDKRQEKEIFRGWKHRKALLIYLFFSPDFLIAVEV